MNKGKRVIKRTGLSAGNNGKFGSEKPRGGFSPGVGSRIACEAQPPKNPFGMRPRSQRVYNMDPVNSIGPLRSTDMAK